MKKCKGTIYKINGKSYCVGEKKSKKTNKQKSKNKLNNKSKKIRRLFK